MLVGSAEGDSLRPFSTDGEHTSMGTSTYIKISFFLFPPFFPAFFSEFSSLCFLILLNPSHQKQFYRNMGTQKYNVIYPTT